MALIPWCSRSRGSQQGLFWCPEDIWWCLGTFFCCHNSEGAPGTQRVEARDAAQTFYNAQYNFPQQRIIEPQMWIVEGWESCFRAFQWSSVWGNCLGFLTRSDRILIISSLISLKFFFLDTVLCPFANFCGAGAAMKRRGERWCPWTGKLLNLDGALSSLEFETLNDLMRKHVLGTK